MNTDNKLHQTYLRDCDCINGGIVINKKGVAMCRWCLKPYAEGGDISYQDCRVNPPVINETLNKKSLLTTKDGVSYFNEEDKCYIVFITPTSFELWKPILLGIPNTEYAGEVYFSTKEAADEYILENKPILSVNDVIICYSSPKDSPLFKAFLNSLKELAKQKLQ